jgi:hypothetical protein
MKPVYAFLLLMLCLSIIIGNAFVNKNKHNKLIAEQIQLVEKKYSSLVLKVVNVEERDTLNINEIAVIGSHYTVTLTSQFDDTVSTRLSLVDGLSHQYKKSIIGKEFKYTNPKYEQLAEIGIVKNPKKFIVYDDSPMWFQFIFIIALSIFGTFALRGKTWKDINKN